MNLKKYKTTADITSPYGSEVLDKSCGSGAAAMSLELAMEEKNPEKLGAKLKQKYETIEKTLPKVKAPHKLACEKGCDYCCHLQVDTTMPEMIHLVAWLKKNLSKEDIAVIREKAKIKHNKVSALPEEEIKFLRIPCPLLKDKECVAYEARPINCRGFYSVELPKCIEGFFHPERDGFNAFWAGPMAVSKNMMHGLLAGLMLRKGKEKQVSYLLEEALTKLL